MTTMFRTSATKRMHKFVVFHPCPFYAHEQPSTRERAERRKDRVDKKAGVGSVANLLPPKQPLPSIPVDNEPPRQTFLGLPLYPVMPRRKLIS